MDWSSAIQRAREAHERLRSEPPGAGRQAAKAGDFLAVRLTLAGLWEAAGTAGGGVTPEAARSAIARLTVDAEYHAGRSDVEGLRDGAEVEELYRLLRQTFTPPPAATP